MEKMKRLLSFVVALVMVLGMIPFAGLSIFEVEAAADPMAAVDAWVKDSAVQALFSGTGNVNARCPVCNKDVTWTAISAGDFKGDVFRTLDHSYLTGDINHTAGGAQWIGDKTEVNCIYLNGKTFTIGDGAGFLLRGGPISFIGGNGGKIVRPENASNASPMFKHYGAYVTNFYGGTYENLNGSDMFYGDATNAQFNLYGGAFNTTGNFFNITYGTDMTINAEITISSGYGIQFTRAADIVMNGGSITYTGESATRAEGGLIHMTVAGATFTMNGGTISGGKATSKGGNVFLKGVTFDMNGGQICDGISSGHGGNIYVDTSSTLNMSGNAQVYGGTCAGDSRGTDIMVEGGTMTMRDNATVVGNTNGTIVCVERKTAGDGASLTMYDNASITSKNGGMSLRVYNFTDDKLILADGWAGKTYLYLNTTETFEHGDTLPSCIQLQGSITGTLKALVGSGDSTKAFNVELEDGKLVFSDEKELYKDYKTAKERVDAWVTNNSGAAFESGYCPVCDKEVTWVDISNITKADFINPDAALDVHVYLSKAATSTSEGAAWTYGDGGKTCIYLNGKTLTMSGNIQARGDISIIAGNGGKIERPATSAATAALLNVIYRGKSLTLYGGEYVDNSPAGLLIELDASIPVTAYGATLSSTKKVYLNPDCSSGVLDLKACTVTGSQVIDTSVGTVNVYDGSVVNGALNTKNSLNLNIYGGTFASNAVIDKEATATVVITGGTFANDPSAYLAADYCAGSAAAPYTVVKGHVYDQNVVKDGALKDAATCTDAAVYYKSCVCGAVGTEATFTSGSAVGHTASGETVYVSPTEVNTAGKYVTYCSCGEIYATVDDEIVLQSVELSSSRENSGTALLITPASETIKNQQAGDTIVKLYRDETLIATTTLKTAFSSLRGSITVALTRTSTSWATTWEAGYPSASVVPNRAELYIDGGVLHYNYTFELDAAEWANFEGIKTPLEHEWVDATCTTPKTCSGCGKTEGEALGHKGGEATCTTKAICEVCGQGYGAEPQGHAPSHKTGEAATCTEDGILEHWYCDGCKTAYTDETCTVVMESTVDPKTGHNPEQQVGKEASCTEAGWEAYWQCECGVMFSDAEGENVITKPVVIPATGHDYTYTSNGDKETHTVGCANCGYSETENCSDENPADKLCDKCEQKLADPVASVDGTPYYTLQEALVAATTGSVKEIVLLADADLTEFDYIPATGLTLNLNNHIVKTNKLQPVIVGENVTIKNGTINGQGASYGLFIGRAGVTTGKVVVENVTVLGGVNIFNASNVTLKNVTANADVENDENDYYAVWAQIASGVVIESGSYTAAAGKPAVSVADGTELVVKGGTFSSNVTAFCEEGKHTALEGGVYAYGEHSYTDTVVGPDFGVEGYTLHECACGHSYKDTFVAAKVAVAQNLTTGEKYESFAEANNAAVAGDTIELLQTGIIDSATIIKDVTIKAEGEFVALRIVNNAFVAINNVTMETKDYAFILGASDGSSAGNLHIFGGNFEAVTSVVSVTKGELVIKDGNFSVEPYEGSYAYLINCIDANYKNGSAVVKIFGGTFENWDPQNNAAEGTGTNFCADGFATVADGDSYKVVKAVAKIGDKYFASFADANNAAVAGDTIELLQTGIIDSATIIKDVTIKAEGEFVALRIVNNAFVAINNVTMETNDYAFILGASDGSSAGTLHIFGGNFEAVTSVVSVTKGELVIKDGNFSVEPYEGSYEYLINCIDANYKNGSAVVKIFGGSFENWNPENNAAEGAGTNFCAEGVHTVEAEGIYTAHKIVAVVDTAVDPTCTATGLTEGSHCETCDRVLVAQETVDALGHSLTETESQDDTCTTVGNSAYWTCGTCGKYFSDAEGEVEIEENSWIIDEIKDHAYGQWTSVDKFNHQRVCANDAAHVETEAHTIVGGSCSDCGYIAYAAQIGGEYFTSVAEALNAANRGDTVKLLGNDTVEMQFVKLGVTLDLNGYTLTADFLAADFAGTYIIDSTDGQGLLVMTEAEGLLINESNTYMPIKTAEGYRFYKAGIDTEYFIENNINDVDPTDDSVLVWFALDVDNNGLAQVLQQSGGVNENIKIRVLLHWVNETGEYFRYYNYSADKVQKVAKDHIGEGFWLKLTGTANVTELEITAEMVLVDENGKPIVSYVNDPIIDYTKGV